MRIVLVAAIAALAFPVLADVDDADPFECTSAPVEESSGPVVTSWPYEDAKPTVLAGAQEDER
jgi:hypothetical protein